MMEWGELRSKVLERIKPEPDEEAEVRALREVVCRRLSVHLKESGVEGSVETHGSVVHGTWLRGEHDLDIFIVLPPSWGRENLPKVLDVVKTFTGPGWVEAYAEHPYIKADISGLSVDFVPCFRVEDGKLISSTDRTPLHTEYLKTRLNSEKCDEVRLLKRFLRGVGVYGAEIKVGGFSGYVAELLVLAYGSFTGVLEAATGWKRNVSVPVVKLEKRKFGDPLIVVDPVDLTRNAASAVSETSMWNFVAASQGFLEKPCERFFYPPTFEASKEDLLTLLNRGSLDTLFLVIDDPKPDVPDILWGQLKKTEKSLGRYLREKGFQVIRTDAWSDETYRHIIVLELESVRLPAVVKQVGPPVYMAEDSERFKKLYIGAPTTVAGPGVEGDRWWVTVRRQTPEAVTCLSRSFSEGGTELGIPRKFSENIRKANILTNGEVAEHIEGGFKNHLHRFISGRPAWLD
jgi:tRNA nucleotidyltransferase (CCA-adding enzyme)